MTSSGEQELKGTQFPKTGMHREAMVRHLLNRAAFGPEPGQVETLKADGALEQWLEQQLRADGFDPEPLAKRLDALKTLRMSRAELLEQFPRNRERRRKNATKKTIEIIEKTATEDMAPEGLKGPSRIRSELALAKIVRGVESERQLQEVLVDFWFNHFNVYAGKGQVNWYISSFESEAIRPFVFGRFRDMLKATAQHPAMLFYLDNWRSVSDSTPKPRRSRKTASRGINENYARELLELHTVGVEGGYTQDDIVSVAKAFTGWTIELPGKKAIFQFRDRAHDRSDITVFGRTFSGVLKPGESGQERGERLLEHLASLPQTGRFLSQKLCRRFVADSPPVDCVEQLSRVYAETNGDLRALYRTLFQSKSFWLAEGKKVKKPFEFLVSALRATGARVDISQSNKVKQNVLAAMSALGEPLYLCQPPTGFKDEASAWVNSGSLVARLKLAIALTSSRWRSVRIDVDQLVGESADEIDTMSNRLIGHALDGKTRQTIERALGRDNDAAGDATETDRTLKRGERKRLAALLLGAPEFQRR
jgi:uncharacterized protein (DUF1800 family)